MRTIASSLLICFALPTFAYGGCSGVEFVLVTEFLDPIPNATLILTGANLTNRLITDKGGSVCASLQPARYTGNVAAIGFRRQFLDYDVGVHPSTKVIVMSIVENFDRTPQTIRGRLKGFGGFPHDLWAVLSHVLGDQRMFARVSAGGSFVFTGNFAGIYQVHVVSKDGLMACTTLSIDSGDRSIELSPEDICSKTKEPRGQP